MKTNKSYTKRIKVTKSGKLLARRSGQNHFNTKERRAAKYRKKRNAIFNISNKARSRFLANF